MRFFILFFLLFFAFPANATEPPIKIGEINSYGRIAAFTLPYKNGLQLAVAEINASGGVLGRPLELISRDDDSKPQNAVRFAEDLVQNEKVDVLFGGAYSNIALALSDYARQNKVLLFIPQGMSDVLTMANGHRYCFRLRSNSYMNAQIMAEEAAKLPAKRWATIAPNYEFGQSFVKNFKAALSARRPDVEFVSEQWPAVGKLDAGTTLQVISRSNPEAIFNATFAADLAALVREGNARGFFKDKSVVSVLTGDPEYMEPLGSDVPEGWIVTGYPWQDITDKRHSKFIRDYQAKFKERPAMASLIGYSAVKMIAAAITKAGSTDTESVVNALENLSVELPEGMITMRGMDHQSDMGVWVGKIVNEKGKPKMTGWTYKPGKPYLPPESLVHEMRKE